ncbi:MAG: serine/threonine protein kinase [Fibrobacterota bacterium]|nr:serine/threonine protein kinase [Fibrobacterota bacterium]
MQLIGEGGTSRIFKALQQPINRIVALKIPSFADAGSVLTPDEFLSEATLMARIEHGHVVRIYDFGVHEDKAFICMEYVEGWNLLELIGARETDPPGGGPSGGGPPGGGPPSGLSVSAVLAAGLQTLEGLLYAHSQGVLHLDLSPANVLVAKSGSVKLSDFGMAGKKFKASQGRIVGTPAFLSPEHVSGEPGTPKSDLFSFASLLYFAATGEPLFDPGEGNSRVTQAIREIGSARTAPPEDRLKRLPRLLLKPVMTALQSDDPDALMREMRDAWKKVEGEERPESVLWRELDLGGDPMSPGTVSDELPTGQALRDKYTGLREVGKHREAVALLEKAMRRQPDNPLLRELLATPPGKAKSAPVTMDVSAAGPAAQGPAQGPAKGPAKGPSKGPIRLMAGAMGILVVTLGFMAWSQGRDAEAPDSPAAKTRASAKTGTAPDHAGFPAPESMPPVALDIKAGNEADPVATRPIDSGRRPEYTQVSMVSKKRIPMPPAVFLSGPAGTKVTVDDTVEWISPAPAGGWPLSPGLVNITLSPPGGQRPISSSLFIAADTLYLLHLEADGGFSVSRKRR